MIDREIFAHWMGVLGDRFARTLKPPTMAAYYDAVQALSTAEFAAAARRCFEEATYWPSPAELTAKARPVPSVEIRAGEAFTALHGLIQTTEHGARYIRPEAAAGLGPSAVRALKAVGYERLVKAGPRDEPHVRRDFCTCYAAAEAERTERERLAAALAAPQVSGSLPARTEQRRLRAS